MPKRVILDVDTGTDDAIAIMMAAMHPDIELLGCTTVWGNLPVANTTDNTLRVLDYIGQSHIPVFRGLDKPFGPIPRASVSSGATNRGGMHPPKLDLPDPVSTAHARPAVEWLVETLREASEPITLVPVGPLTNIAAAITMDPSIVGKVEEIVIMGGANEFGNVTPSAEANIWHDPVAADVVFKAGFERLVLVPLDATHDALITADQSAEVRSLGTPGAIATAMCLDQRVVAHDTSQPQVIPHSAAVHDALCIAYLLDPNVIPLDFVHVAVETVGELTFGRTVMDIRQRGSEAPNAYVALTADRAIFFDLMKGALATNS